MAVPPFELKPGPDYAYAQLASHLEALVRAGELAPGARLAGERDMAAEYGVAVGTVRKAVKTLRDRGLLVTTPQLGTFVTGQGDLRHVASLPSSSPSSRP